MRGRDRWAALVIVALVLGAAFPFYRAVAGSLTTEAQLFEGAPLWPRPAVFDHYRALFTERDFWLPIRNSLVVAGATTLFNRVVAYVDRLGH